MDGWALLYKTVERDIETKADVLFAVAHWQLLRNGMKCIGLGDDRNLSESDVESELLPEGWNMNKNSYALRYKHENQVFVLLGSLMEDDFALNFLSGKSMEATNATFILEPTVAATKGQLNTLIPEIKAVTERLQNELFQPLISPSKQTSGTQTFTISPGNSPLPKLIPTTMIPRDYYLNSPDNLHAVGRRDLDPFGGTLGGGMLYNPPGLTNPLSGGVGGMLGRLPGARFDPLHPPEVERQRRRNSRDFDHFPPPGGSGSSFYDDMFG